MGVLGTPSPGSHIPREGCFAIIPDLSLWHSKRARAGVGASPRHFPGDHLSSRASSQLQNWDEDEILSQLLPTHGGVPAAATTFLHLLQSWKAAAQEGEELQCEDGLTPWGSLPNHSQDGGTAPGLLEILRDCWVSLPCGILAGKGERQSLTGSSEGRR